MGLSSKLLVAIIFQALIGHFVCFFFHTNVKRSNLLPLYGVKSNKKAVPLPTRVNQAVNEHAKDICKGLQEKGYAIVDNFLGMETMDILRKEAEGFYNNNSMVISQSTRFDPETQTVVTYDKHNVYSMQLMGGDDYEKGPRLHEYVVSLVKSTVPPMLSTFPDSKLSPTLASNKLAVCIGDGSYYDKHFDNTGLDTRKLTVIYYMQKKWRPECGGQFRIFDGRIDDNGDTVVTTTDIPPLGDRMLVFWADQIVHSVLPSFAPRGKQDHRYALTVWLFSTSPDAIVRDDVATRIHFPDLQAASSGG